MADRAWDKYIAYHLGYRVSKLEGTALYVLHKPHRRALSGLSELKGPGPVARVPSKNERTVAYTQEDAWEWVPCFSTNEQHAQELRAHFLLVLEHSIPACYISAEQIARYSIKYFRMKLKK